jgi:hypothetical protein
MLAELQRLRASQERTRRLLVAVLVALAVLVGLAGWILAEPRPLF